MIENKGILRRSFVVKFVMKFKLNNKIWNLQKSDYD